VQALIGEGLPMALDDYDRGLGSRPRRIWSTSPPTAAWQPKYRAGEASWKHREASSSVRDSTKRGFHIVTDNEVPKRSD
jgi:hypothetical protein